MFSLVISTHTKIFQKLENWFWKNLCCWVDHDLDLVEILLEPLVLISSVIFFFINHYLLIMIYCVNTLTAGTFFRVDDDVPTYVWRLHVFHTLFWVFFLFLFSQYNPLNCIQSCIIRHKSETYHSYYTKYVLLLLLFCAQTQYITDEDHYSLSLHLDKRQHF